MSAQKDSKDNELAAARTIEIDGLKQIAQLKNDVKVAESKLVGYYFIMMTQSLG